MRNPKLMCLYSKMVTGPRQGLMGLGIFGDGHYSVPPSEMILWMRASLENRLQK
jgi:hypothetical protein